MELHSAADLDRLDADIDRWLAAAQLANPSIDAVQRGEPGTHRWYVRLHGEDKEVITVWLTLGQRTLSHETYVWPAPVENHAAFYEHVLRRNRGLVGAHFCIGAEDALYLVGAVPVSELSEDALDWVIGTVYATVERCFRAGLALGFGSMLRAAGVLPSVTSPAS